MHTSCMSKNEVAHEHTHAQAHTHAQGDGGGGGDVVGVLGGEMSSSISSS